MKILIINGPNMQLLGKRPINTYGSMCLNDLEHQLLDFSKSLENLELDFFQSNSEGSICDKIGSYFNEGFEGIVINPAAYTHTSIAIQDALEAIQIPVIEVHISNIYKRENFRHNSLILPNCIGQFFGIGISGYKLAIKSLYEYLNLFEYKNRMRYGL